MYQIAKDVYFQVTRKVVNEGSAAVTFHVAVKAVRVLTDLRVDFVQLKNGTCRGIRLKDPLPRILPVTEPFALTLPTGYTDAVTAETDSLLAAEAYLRIIGAAPPLLVEPEPEPPEE